MNLSKLMTHGEQVKAIDLTPTWTSFLPSLLLLYAHGNTEGRKVAEKELQRMAMLADSLIDKAEVNA